MKTRVLCFFTCLTLAQMSAAQSVPSTEQDSAVFDPDGTAHITRVIPMPSTISPESQKWLASLTLKKSGPETLAERRAHTDAWRAQDSAEARRIYPVNVEEKNIAGVRTDIITPLEMPEANRRRVLINLHGGGFNSDSGSLIEGIPIANLAKIKVVSVYYRLAPENPFPAAVDDVVAVYKELLKNYKRRSIGIFGTSAGAILTAEVAVRLKQMGVPLPGALGIFPGTRILARWATRGSSSRSMDSGRTAADLSESPPRRFLRGQDRPQGSSTVADLRRLARYAADSARNQLPRHLAEWYDDFPPRAAQRWR